MSEPVTSAAMRWITGTVVHERAVLEDGFADREAAQHEEFQLGCAGLLDMVGGQTQCVTLAEDGEPPLQERAAFGAGRAVTRQHVDQRVAFTAARRATPRRS